MEPKIGKTYLTEIPHEGGKLSFQYPAFRGDYGNVAEQIDNNRLKRPNSAETASLVYDAFQNPDGKYESEIIKILKNAGWWEFTGNLHLTKSNEEVNNGVILETNPKITNGKLNMNKKSLIKRLYNNDSLVKFVPFGYKIGEQTESELMKNPYIVARYGKEGAEKIAEVAGNCGANPHVYSFNSVDEEKTKMSSLDNGWALGVRLYISHGKIYEEDNGCAFGVNTHEKRE